MEYQIYYGDGSVYSGPLKDAPPLDVQAIAEHDVRGSPYEVGRRVIHCWDFYLYADGQWIGINGMVDLVDHILHRSIEKVLKGRMISSKQYEAILHRATNDPGMPRKSCHNPEIEDGR